MANANMNKRDFGSFHSSNVQELIGLSEKEYQPPVHPFHLADFSTLKQNGFEFGKSARRNHFLLEDCTFLNHGAFGGVLKEALQAAQKWQEYAEKQPLRFYDRELLPYLVFVTRKLAHFVGCDPTDIVLVTNATTGINCAVRSFNFSPGDVIFTLSISYGAVKKLLRQVCQETGAVLKEAVVQFPVTGPQQLTDLVRRELDEKQTKLAVFDHIPSNAPFIVPVEEIIQVCHEKNVPVLIDGAHALGSLPLDLKSMNPDFYVSNAHKWLCSPKGAAFLYVSRSFQPVTRPLVLSHGFGSGFSSEFIWAGLHDYSPFLALHTVLDFWDAAGVESVRKYMHQLAKQAGIMGC